MWGRRILCSRDPGRKASGLPMTFVNHSFWLFLDTFSYNSLGHELFITTMPENTSLLCSHLQHSYPFSSTQTCTFYFPSPLFNFPISWPKSIKIIDGYDFVIGGCDEHAPLRKKHSLCHLVGSTQEPLMGTGEQSDIDRQLGQTDGTRALWFTFLVTAFVGLIQIPLNHCCLF